MTVELYEVAQNITVKLNGVVQNMTAELAGVAQSMTVELDGVVPKDGRGIGCNSPKYIPNCIEYLKI